MNGAATRVALTSRTATASTACRAEGRRGRVASVEGARDAGMGQNRGRGRRFRPGRDASAASGRAGGERRLHGEEQRGRWSEGKFVNRAKFKTPVCNFSFSPSTWPQMKNF